jgi:pyruvate kinase
MNDYDIPSKKTKIICTIGPASQSPQVLQEMIANGMNIARINFAHGDLDSHRQTIANVRAAAEKADRRVAIFGDLPGPKMRIGVIAEESITLQRDQPFILQTEECVGSDERASLDFAGLPHVVQRGDSIFMNDGYIELVVKQVKNQEVHCKVKAGGELRSHKGVNFPGIDLGINAFTPRDHELLTFAAEQQLDGVSQSFVLGPQDIEAVRQAAQALDYHPLIIAKIERSGALKNIEAILDACDAIMVARGDLGVEIPIEDIPSVQKHLIRRTNLRAKPVITATQMLETMTENRRPTRAEVTDVANAILDGTDCVMLSGETAVGAYPVETVSVMARIAKQTEGSMHPIPIGKLLQLQRDAGDISRDDLMSLIAYLTAETIEPVIILLPSRSGGTARRMTRFRLEQWIIAISQNEKTCQSLQFSYGIHPIHVTEKEVLAEPHLRRQFATNWMDRQSIHEGLVLLIEGAGTLKAEDTKRLDIIAL